MFNHKLKPRLKLLLKQEKMNIQLRKIKKQRINQMLHNFRSKPKPKINRLRLFVKQRKRKRKLNKFGNKLLPLS
nr:MAG TPA: hypothetical protein [Caudoviricetes sp.]